VPFYISSQIQEHEQAGQEEKNTEGAVSTNPEEIDIGEIGEDEDEEFGGEDFIVDATPANTKR